MSRTYISNLGGGPGISRKTEPNRVIGACGIGCENESENTIAIDPG